MVEDGGCGDRRSEVGDEHGGYGGGIGGGEKFREREWRIVGFEKVEVERELGFIAEVNWWGS